MGVDAGGTPASVSVVQRLLIGGKGDYVYSVPAPVTSVAPTADSASQPGLRSGAILWAGFSPGKRLLGARARLALRPAARYLPLRVVIRTTVDARVLHEGEQRSGSLVVHVTFRNATQATTRTAAAAGDTATLARTLDAARRGSFPATPVVVSVRAPAGIRHAKIEAPLVVTGVIALRARRPLRRSFSFELGDGRPLTRTLSFATAAVDARTPAIRVTAATVRPKRTLTPPDGAPSWAAYARRIGSSDSRELLVVAEDAFLRAARASQYDAYLKNPTLTVGTSKATYAYVTAAPRSSARPAQQRGTDMLEVVLIAAGSLAALAAVVVWWAHS